MRAFFIGFAMLVAALFTPHEVKAQAIILPCVPSGTSCIPVSAANPLPVTNSGAVFPPSGCVTANGVIFNNATPCDSGFTYAGAGGTVSVQATLVANIVQVANGSAFQWGNGSKIVSTGSGVFVFENNGNTQNFTVNTSATAGEVDFSGGIGATLATATGTNVVCNTPGTKTAITVQVSATGCAASSARFKEGIASIDRVKALDTVLGLKPVSYRYKSSYANDPDEHIGFTAEQVASLPSPVDGYSLTTMEPDGEQLHAVKYNEMVPLLVAAIQKISADFESYKRSHP